jgi:hypothetical protein
MIDHEPHTCSVTFPSRQDYDRLDVVGAIGAELTCDGFPRVLGAQARTSAASGDEAARLIFSLLEDVCSFGLKTDDRREPFGPRFQFTDGRRSVSIEDLSDEQVGFLELIVDSIPIADLRARVADVLFTRRKHERFGRLALEAYMEAGEVLITSTESAHAASRFMRALSLAASVRSERERVVSWISKQLADRRPDETYFTARLMESMIDHRCGDPANMADVAHDAAELAGQERNWDRAQEYLLLESKWHAKTNDRESSLRCRTGAAECYVKMADSCGADIIEVSHLERAIQSLRTVPGTQSRVEVLHRRLLLKAETAVQGFREISFPLNFEEPATRARSQVRGRSMRDAVVRMAMIHRPFSIEMIRTAVVDEAKANTFLGMLPRTKVNRLGKVVANRGSLLAENPEEQEANLRLAMFEKAGEFRQGVAVGVLNPARAMVAEEHYLGTRELLQLASASGFVPLGREEMFARGLASGFEGDFVAATHILMPQFEHSVRMVLAAHGALTSKIDDDGVQDEKDLGTLLYLPDARRVFGDDLVFEMQGLLVERCGSNLRNELAHGLLELEDCLSPRSVYFWWLTLHLVVIPLIRPNGADGEAEGSVREAG